MILEPAGWATTVSLFVAGVLGSVHCVAMCGPFLLAFEGWARTGTAGTGAEVAMAQDRAGRLGRAVAYHLGRIWTYSLLGFGAAWFKLHAFSRFESSLVGRSTLLAVGIALVLAAAYVVRLDPSVRPGWLARPVTSCAATLGGDGALGALARRRGLAPRFLLGTAMGLLPCGLVYAAVLVAATRPPLESALGMTAFGLGTLPALGLATWSLGLLPERWRRVPPPRVAVWLLLLAAAVLLMRAAPT